MPDVLDPSSRGLLNMSANLMNGPDMERGKCPEGLSQMEVGRSLRIWAGQRVEP